MEILKYGNFLSVQVFDLDAPPDFTVFEGQEHSFGEASRSVIVLRISSVVLAFVVVVVAATRRKSNFIISNFHYCKLRSSSTRSKQLRTVLAAKELAAKILPFRTSNSNCKFSSSTIRNKQKVQQQH